MPNPVGITPEVTMTHVDPQHTDEGSEHAAADHTPAPEPSAPAAPPPAPKPESTEHLSANAGPLVVGSARDFDTGWPRSTGSVPTDQWLVIATFTDANEADAVTTQVRPDGWVAFSPEIRLFRHNAAVAREVVRRVNAKKGGCARSVNAKTSGAAVMFHTAESGKRQRKGIVTLPPGNWVMEIYDGGNRAVLTRKR